MDLAVSFVGQLSPIHRRKQGNVTVRAHPWNRGFYVVVGFFLLSTVPTPFFPPLSRSAPRRIITSARREIRFISIETQRLVQPRRTRRCHSGRKMIPAVMSPRPARIHKLRAEGTCVPPRASFARRNYAPLGEREINVIAPFWRTVLCTDDDKFSITPRR